VYYADRTKMMLRMTCAALLGENTVLEIAICD
jgi:hypothetical protein